MPGCTTWRVPDGKRATRLSAEIPFIVFDQPAFKHRYILVLERRYSVMLFLIQNIMSNRFNVRGARGESSVAFLSSEPRQFQFAVNPSR